MTKGHDAQPFPPLLEILTVFSLPTDTDRFEETADRFAEFIFQLNLTLEFIKTRHGTLFTGKSILERYRGEPDYDYKIGHTTAREVFGEKTWQELLAPDKSKDFKRDIDILRESLSSLRMKIQDLRFDIPSTAKLFEVIAEKFASIGCSKLAQSFYTSSKKIVKGSSFTWQPEADTASRALADELEMIGRGTSGLTLENADQVANAVLAKVGNIREAQIHVKVQVMLKTLDALPQDTSQAFKEQVAARMYLAMIPEAQRVTIMSKIKKTVLGVTGAVASSTLFSAITLVMPAIFIQSGKVAFTAFAPGLTLYAIIVGGIYAAPKAISVMAQLFKKVPDELQKNFADVLSVEVMNCVPKEEATLEKYRKILAGGAKRAGVPGIKRDYIKEIIERGPRPGGEADIGSIRPS